MKAWVYIVQTAQRWQAHMSIEMDVDIRYWLEAAFREGVLGDEGRTPSGTGECMLIWTAPLPLGQAMQAVEAWTRGLRQSMGTVAGWRGNEREAGKRLIACVQGVVGKTEEKNRQTGMVDLSRYAAQGWGSGAADNPPALTGGKAATGNRAAESHIRLGYGVSAPQGSTGYPAVGQQPPGPLLTRARPRATRAPATARAQGQALAAAAHAAARALQGRALLRREAHDLLDGAGAASPEAAGWSGALQLAALLGRLRLSSAVAADAASRRPWALPRLRPQARCLRCGSGGARLRRTPCGGCGRMCAYCEACLTMGKARECELLVRGGLAQRQRGASAGPEAALAERLQRWGLSPAQQAAAGQALRYMEQAPAASPQAAERNFLLWAVTGAGKTEMIFPLIDSVLQRGGRALVATPRRDVVLELDPRIRRAFPEATVVTLYGGSEQRWEQGQITLATTHQLIRFDSAFDLVVVDEIDAFPFHGDEMLYYAAGKVRAPQGVQVLLSATPPGPLRRAARSGRLAHASVPVRYHRHPLPVPQLLRIPSVVELIKRRLIPAPLKRAMETSLTRGAQLFVFIQQIRHIEPLVALLSQVFPEW